MGNTTESLALFSDIIEIILHPTGHLQAWVFTLTFGAILSVGFWMAKSFASLNNDSSNHLGRM